MERRASSSLVRPPGPSKNNPPSRLNNNWHKRNVMLVATPIAALAPSRANRYP